MKTILKGIKIRPRTISYEDLNDFNSKGKNENYLEIKGKGETVLAYCIRIVLERVVLKTGTESKFTMREESYEDWVLEIEGSEEDLELIKRELDELITYH